MRISSQQVFINSLSAILNRQSEAARIQQQVASGDRLSRAADDPTAARGISLIDRSLERNGQFGRNAELLEFRLRSEESAIASATDGLQSIRELALQAGNAALSAADRQSLALEMREGLGRLLQIANSKDESGNAIFAGFQRDTDAYAFRNGSYTYLGDEGQRQLDVGPGLRIADSDPGTRVFSFASGDGEVAASALSSNTGTVVIQATLASTADYNGQALSIEFTAADRFELRDAAGTVLDTVAYETGVALSAAGLSLTLSGSPEAGDSFTVAPSSRTSVFDAVQRLADSLAVADQTPGSRALQQNALNRGLEELSGGIEQLIQSRSEVGVRLQHLDLQRESNEGAALQLQTLRSSLADVDFAESVTELNRALLSLEASQAAFAKVQNLSLFNYIR